jgi:hypothetical protein
VSRDTDLASLAASAFKTIPVQPDIQLANWVEYQDEFGVTRACISTYYDDSSNSPHTVYPNHYGARLLGPGYIDSTDWTIHKTYSEALEHLMTHKVTGMKTPTLPQFQRFVSNMCM